MDVSFRSADKENLAPLLPQLFRILHGNMSAIAPTGCTYEEDFALWSGYMVPALAEPERQLVLMHREGALAGYFQYSVQAGTLLMEEIQIAPAHQGTGLFRGLYHWLEHALPCQPETVEAYAHKDNRKSQAILERLGLKRAGENPGGTSWHYQGSCREMWESLRERNEKRPQ